MKGYQFEDTQGTFHLKKAENISYLYFPIAGEAGLKSSLTPNLGGDAKIDQNTFLLEPVSAENLVNNRNSRNFWCNVKGIGSWSLTGNAAEALSKKFTEMQDDSEVTAGFMWQKTTRESKKYQLRGEILSFIPVEKNVEVMLVTITNTGRMAQTVTPTAAIPLYGRSADNIRDHRHVTSLLHRIETTDIGVLVTPTLSFDERGHQVNHMTYYCVGWSGNGEKPVDFYPTAEDFVGEGGNFERPYAIVKNAEGVKAGTRIEGLEAVGGLHFSEVTLEPEEECSYLIFTGITEDIQEIRNLSKTYTTREMVLEELEKTKAYWQEKVNVAYHTGDSDFNQFMHWVSFQPILRRIYGCSFLPHHDYGKGGRGWRDLWQDCLALLIMNPDGVRQMLLDNFAGVRVDGSNATIIGSKQGEFVADRNHITRVWMDHGVWPMITTKFYIDQTGDLELLEKEAAYFKDKQIARGTRTDTLWDESYGCWQKTKRGVREEGTILEHLLLQNLTAFYEVGEHNNIRLRGADWNDALDMASEKGESVAFSNAYAGNLADIAELLEAYRKKTGKETVSLLAEIVRLLEDNPALYDSVEKKLHVLEEYLHACEHDTSGEKVEISIEKLTENLRHKSEWLMEHIRKNEWVKDSEESGWFNGYYDNHGRQVEGDTKTGVRMMLTGQVFPIMAGTATDEQIRQITKSADRYLYDEKVGGYRLNTDFGEVKTDLGRMFGFSYGDKENGAVFSHMAVMYANALYKRGFAKEGYKSLHALYRQSANFEVSRIYPGIPEYFNGRGRGMYHYLTGAASWYMLTVITEMFGVRGQVGDMILEPKLLKEQFDEEKKASLTLQFADKNWKITYLNREEKDYGEYQIADVTVDGEKINFVPKQHEAILPKNMIEKLSGNETHQIEVVLAQGNITL